MKNRISISVLIYFLFQNFAYKGLAQLIIDAQFRTRFELRDGYQKLAKPDAISAEIITQRTRLNLNYETEKLRFKFSIQDVRVWGDDTNVSFSGSTGNYASIDLYEGYADLKLGTSGWLTLGRQQLVYDNQSILGNANWNQNGIASDAAVLKLKKDGWNLHLAGSWNSLTQLQSGNTYDTIRYKSLNFLWLNRKFSDDFSFSVIHVSAGVMDSNTGHSINFSQTSGTYFTYNARDFDLWANAYYQFGKNRKGISKSAFMMDAEINYKFGKLTPAFGFSYLSGNNKTDTGVSVDNLFEGIYRARHNYFGFIDYFTIYDSQTNSGGLVDYYLYFEYKFSKSVRLTNTSHYFQLAQTNPSTPADKNLGYENDLILKYKFNDWGALEFGYMFFLPTESLKTIQNVPENKLSQFIYLQLTLTPTLFKQIKEKEEKL